MKLSQSIEYNMRNIFLENHTKMLKKLFPDLFLKNQDLAYLWINGLKLLYSLFLLYTKLRPVEIY